jgi:hypothetical protein
MPVNGLATDGKPYQKHRTHNFAWSIEAVPIVFGAGNWMVIAL